MCDTVEELPSTLLACERVQEQAVESVGVMAPCRAAISDSSPAPTCVVQKRSTWAQTEGTPLPLGATWIEDEQAFNFAVYAEHADSVTLLLYSASDFANPVLTFKFDFLHNKSGHIWHFRIPFDQMRGAKYFAYSVSGISPSHLRCFNAEK